ncbi:hypothetical protein [Streptacidiphilus sp. EB129]|uniref:hypothetical protein n=1 Tax=Streptacidiphilus sp. EB129 TaxID=3156262 RepID=UPI00351394CF
MVSWPWWLLVLATTRVRGVVAGYGTAMVILEGPAVPARRQAAAVGIGGIGAALLGVLGFPVLWAAYHATRATGLPRPVAEPLCTAALAAVFIAEARAMIRSGRNASAARRVRLGQERGAAYWEASCLVAAPDGISAGRLCRNLLHWADAHQIGVVASAATPPTATNVSASPRSRGTRSRSSPALPLPTAPP